MRALLFLAFILPIFFISCEREVEEFDERLWGYDYFPVEIGKSWIYQVDSTIYDDNGGTVINSSSQIREVIVDSFVDDVGDEIYRIERSWRANDTSSWQITDVWVTYVDEGRAYRTEENLKFIKFVFPALEGKTWNGNIFFDEFTEVIISGEPIDMYVNWDDYDLVSVDETEEVGSENYEDVATVLQTDYDETLDKRFALEKYARGVGLIYKENIILKTQNSDTSIPWEERAESGFILKQVLLESN